MDRLVNNFVLAMALSVLETWDCVRAEEKSRAAYNHPILFVASVEAAEVLKLWDQHLWSQEMFGYPHGKVWQPINEMVEA